ncbi:acetyltransferases [Eggerthella sp. CAG:298]|nr:acetyltransferases [Eggerthella sp. CAG:298]
MDIDVWMNDLIDQLKTEFKERLVLVRLQGSRARDEQREDSDIDIVVAIEDLNADDLASYRSVIQKMPHAELACGFIGSPDVLAAWPRHDVFNLANDTDIRYGSFDFMDTEFTAEEAKLAADACASEIYHALCHTAVFEPNMLPDLLQGCLKSVFFGIRAKHFAQTGEFVNSRAQLSKLANSDEKKLLQAYDGDAQMDDQELANRLLRWSSSMLME